MLTFGIMSFVLPLLGRQFVLLNMLAPETLHMVQMGLIGGGLLLGLVGAAVEGNSPEPAQPDAPSDAW
jgi:hypothetical protein